MFRVGGSIQLSASDLVGHLNCRYLTELDLAVARGEVAKPSIWDPVLEVLAQRGAQHEKAYIDHLKSQGHAVTVIDGVGVEANAVDKTLAAMKSGAAIIIQGALQDSADSDEGGQLFRSIADTIPMIADRRCRRRQQGVTAADWRQALTVLAAALRMLSPFKVSLWALWTRRSRMASATVGLAIASCQ